MMANSGQPLPQEELSRPRRTLFSGTSLDLVHFSITGTITSAILVSQCPRLSSEISLGGVHSSVLVLRFSVITKPVYAIHSLGGGGVGG